MILLQWIFCTWFCCSEYCSTSKASQFGISTDNGMGNGKFCFTMHRPSSGYRLQVFFTVELCVGDSCTDFSVSYYVIISHDVTLKYTLWRHNFVEFVCCHFVPFISATIDVAEDLQEIKNVKKSILLSSSSIQVNICCYVIIGLLC